MTDKITKPYQQLAWLGSTLVCISAALASLDYYPLAIYGFLIANSIWVLIGVLWDEKSLIIMNATLIVIYIIGLVGHYFLA